MRLRGSDMEIRHLKMIKEVAKHGSLTIAAKHLFLSQSALSHQLKDIESFFKTQIFIRQNKRMLLTQTGRIILEASEKIINEIEGAKDKIELLEDNDTGEIRISTECYTSYHWLSEFIKDFKQSFPKIEVMINPDATYLSEKYLLEDKIDIAIVEKNNNSMFNYETLFTDEFVALVASNHPWTLLKYVTPALFSSEYYIMYNIPRELSTIYNILFKKTEPKKIYRITLTEAIIQMVKAGLGVTVLPNWVAKPYIRSGQLKAILVKNRDMKRTWYAATLKNKQQPKFISDFIHKLAKHIKQSDELRSNA